MSLFKQKKKQCEVVYIEEHVIVIRGVRWHHHDHELQEIKKLILSNEKKLDKILKVIGTTDGDAAIRQQIFDGLNKAIKDIESTV